VDRFRNVRYIGRVTAKLDCRPDELKERAARGDPELLEDLFTCFRADLTAFLRQRCGNTGDADDAVQDVFVTAARYLEGYRGETTVKNWLYRLASSACTRMRRGRKNDPKLHDAFEESGASPGVERMGKQVEAMLEARLMPLQSAMATLAPTDRAVLMLRDGHELSTREVAEQLELSEAAVKSRLHRARKTLKQHLSE
jgi:RNA polymerase sigma-70 factor (ECF subfamily)